MSQPDIPSPPSPARPAAGGFGKYLVAGAMVAAFVVGLGLWRRQAAYADLSHWTAERALPVVALVQPSHPHEKRLLTLPGDVAAFIEASLHGQVLGYVKSWDKDIGARVVKGDVLAEIDTPELDEQLAQAQQEVAKAHAAQNLAAVTAKRWAALKSSSAVSLQASDEKDSDASVKDADLGAARANLQRLKAKKAFANIVAPFDGVVTARNIDIGALVSPDNANQTLFKVADIHTVRLYVRAPQVYAADLKQGMSAHFTLPQFPQRVFDAKITNTSNAISEKSRALLVELQADNADGAILPGSFAKVAFILADDPSALRLPATALVFGHDGMKVATLGSDRHVHFKAVQVSSDLGDEVEIAAGVDLQDRIIDNPPDILAEGDEVRTAVKSIGDIARDDASASGKL